MASVNNLFFFRMNFHFRLHVGIKKNKWQATGLKRFRNLMNRYFLLNLTLNCIFYLLRIDRLNELSLLHIYIYLMNIFTLLSYTDYISSPYRIELYTRTVASRFVPNSNNPVVILRSRWSLHPAIVPIEGAVLFELFRTMSISYHVKSQFIPWPFRTISVSYHIGFPFVKLFVT